MIRRYRISTRGDLSQSELSEAQEIIKNVLNDPRGWKQYGYSFEDLTDNPTATGKDILTVYFYTNKNMIKKYPDLAGLSAYDISYNKIYFNIDNWNNGGVDPFSGNDPIDRYRTYVINHEFGHSLGLDHIRPKNRKGKKGSIMMQMTKGLEHIAPCTLNEYPLPPEDFDEFKEGKHLTYLPHPPINHTIKGGNGGSGINCIIYLLICIVLVMIVVKTIRCICSYYIGQNERITNLVRRISNFTIRT